MAEHPSLPAGGRGAEITTRPVAPPDVPRVAAPVAEPASDWQRYLTAVSRHRWAVLVVTLLGTTLGFVGSQFLDARYAAHAILWIANAGGDDERGLISGEQVVEPAGWVELVRSNAVLDSVVRRMRLYLRPRSPVDSAALATFHLLDERVRPGRYRLAVTGASRRLTLSLDDGAAVGHGAAGDTLGAGLGFAWALPPHLLSPGRKVEFTLVAPYDAVQELAASLKVKLDPAGSFLRLQLRGTNPSLTATTVNAIADRVVVVAAELKRRKFEELAKILGGQYQHARQALASADRALAAARARNADVLPAHSSEGDSRPDPTFARAFDLRLEAEDLRRDRRAIEAALKEVPRGGLRLEALAAIRSVRESPPLALALDEATRKQADLRAQRYRYTEESAPVRQARAELATLEQRMLPALAEELAAQLAARETALAPQVDSAFRHLRRVPTLSLEHARLERDVASAAELFTDVRQRYEAARLALVSSLPDLSILDQAVEPRRPASDLIPLLVALSFAASFGLAVAGVTVRDRLDPKVRYPEQITSGMRLTILGAVPHLGWRTARRDGGAEVVEALRGLRLRVLHAHGIGGPLLLTVTSPAAGDGKSFISANLAMSFAHAGYRTLLVDGDVRRGSQHRALGTPQRPGLTDVLTGDATLEAALRATEHDDLTFLSRGTRMERAPELLMSPHLRELMARLREAYSVVIVDSPPLAAGVDPLVFGTATGQLLLVLRAGVTDLPLTLSKLDVVGALPVRTIGAVLNDVRGTDAFRYYTYEISDDTERPVAALGWNANGRIVGG